MGPSNSSRGLRRVVLFDRVAVGGLAIGLMFYVLPIWREGRLRWGFWLTLVSTLLHIYTSHARSARESEASPGSDG